MDRPLLTPIGLLTGKLAIKFAISNGLRVNKYATDSEAAEYGIDPVKAEKIAKTNPELIWLDIK